MWLDLLQTAIDGLMVGGLYTTVALGITLVFGLVGILNFAHGQMVMLGAYVAFFTVASGMPFWLGLTLAALSMALVGGVLERFIFRRTLTDPMAGLTVSLGIIMIVENLAAGAFTPNPRFMDAPLEGSWQWGPVTLPAQRLLVLAVAVALIAVFYIFLRKARLGKAIRAMAQNRQGASLVGVRTTQVSAAIFVIGSALAGAAGALYASLYSISPYMGMTPLMKGFILAAFGGLGSVPGAILAGFLLGMSESFGARYLSAAFRDGYGFVLLIVVLLVLPNGLLGTRKGRI